MATQSLYRRYRPRKFSEVKGQDHIVRALRDAVIAGREGQAYLFSGPRGTGKTTTARILAKVLNCSNVVDGEPCTVCDSCLAVEKGTSYDVHELDAASNNGVEAIRDLIEKASLGTPGRHKVYILDEVHMLSKPAEAALLKTLEEPPPHVVFVLATTDPQKMSDTIRSRTQHLQFHLLPTDTLAEHVKWVASDAGYELPQAAFDAALTQGGGSARDTLSALELIASSGGEVDEAVDLDEFIGAFIDHDAARALTAMGRAMAMGRDPRTVTEELVRHLRNSFLSLMAPELVVLPSERLDAVSTMAQQVGAAGLVRAIERLGSTLADMRNAPDPRVLVEVVLVQLTHAEAGGGDVDALNARIERLEQKVKALAEAGPAVAAAPPAATDPSTGRAVIGGAARRPTRGEAASQQADTSTPPAEAPAPAAPAAPSGMSVPEAWDRSVKSSLKPLVRALYSAGSFTGNNGDAWTFTVPSEMHGSKCQPHRQMVEQLLSEAVGRATTLEIVVKGGRSGGAPSTPPSGSSNPGGAGSGTAGQPAGGGPAGGATTGGQPMGGGSNPAPQASSSAPPTTPISPASSGPGSSGPASSGPGSSGPATSGPGSSGPATVPRPATSTSAAPAHPAAPQAAAAAPLADASFAPEAPFDDGYDDFDSPPVELQSEDEIDLSDLTDAPPESVRTPLDQLADAFPGSELMTDD